MYATLRNEEKNFPINSRMTERCNFDPSKKLLNDNCKSILNVIHWQNYFISVKKSVMITKFKL